MQIAKRGRVLILCCLGAAVAQAPRKRALTHRDYEGWKAISSQVFSRDGKFLAYALFPEEGDGEMVIRDLITGKELHESAGSVPPPPDTQNFEAPAEAAVTRGLQILITHDAHYLISNVFPKKAETDQAKKDRKPATEMPKPGLLIVDLQKMHAGTSASARVADVANYQIPETGGDILAYLKSAQADAGGTAASGSGEDWVQNSDQGRGGRGGGTGRGGASARKFGSRMTLRDLASGSEKPFEDVGEYNFAKDGKTLVYTVASRKEETNGIFSLAPSTDAAAVTLLAGKGRYSKLAWDFSQKQLAFISDRDDPGAKPAKFKAYLWDRTSAPPVVVAAAGTPGLKSDWGLAEGGTLGFSQDGSKLYINCAPLAMLAAAERPVTPTPAPGASATTVTNSAGEEKLLADLWHWKDDYIQPMQKVRAGQERNRTYRAVVNLADKKFVQLADPSMNTVTPSDNGRLAFGNDDREYRHMVDYDGTYSDVYLVDTNTGSRKLVMKQVHGGGGGRGGGGGMQWSPDGSRILAFKDKDWYSIEAPSGTMVNLTAKLGTNFLNEDHDTPDTPPSYGSPGWMKDSSEALVYDHYDVWAVKADGSGGRKITDGRAAGLQYRLARLDRTDGGEDRGIDPAKGMTFRVENMTTRDSGVYTLADFAKGKPEKKIMAAKNFALLGKAKDADVIMLTATTFHDPPDLQTTDFSFKELRKVTDANPQQASLSWGKGELTKYRNVDGVELQAAIYKPENFDPTKKYPMMVYIYERLSQNVNNFVRPAPGTSINMAYYVSNGYIVLTPDIVYTTGHPGQSALKCVLPAIQSIVEKGYVDRDHIGIQGHSWGGYQIAYMLTQTNLFRAAEAGAPVVNMISAYDGIRWGTGLPRQFQYEKTQSRIGGTPWEYPLRFIENSTIFMADRVTTPLLILQNDADDAVPWYQGIEMFLALRRLGKEVYLFDYNGEPHGLRKRSAQKDYTVRMQQYFDHYLKGAPAPEWMEKGIPYIEREQEKEKFNSVYSDALKEVK